MLNIIAACSSNSVIGVNNQLPFIYPDDMQHFKRKTDHGTVIMGRRTFESLGKLLPRRRNIVISSENIVGVENYSSMMSAIESLDPQGNNWFIGGASIYQEALLHADEIHLTITPDIIHERNAIKFPWVNPLEFDIHSITSLVPGDDTLKYCIYKRV